MNTAVELTERQADPGGFASTWHLTVVPLRSKFGGCGGRENFERDFRVVARRVLNRVAQGDPAFFDQPCIGYPLVQYAFETGGRTQRHGIHFHSIIQAVHAAKGARMDYAAIRSEFNSALACSHHVHGRIIKGVHSLDVLRSYLTKSK
jgi:hypothetical protein